MRKYHLIWVTARMHIEIYRYPAWYCNLISLSPAMIAKSHLLFPIPCYTYIRNETGVTWLRLRHGVKVKDG